MPYIEKAIHVGEYILIEHEGHFTREEYEQSTVSTRILLDEHRWNRILVDLRSVANRVPIVDVYHIIEFDKVVFPLVKIAVIFPPEREENGRFADNVAANRGVNLKSFIDHEKAVAWLTSKET